MTAQATALQGNVFGTNQTEPPEGRKMIVLPPLYFVTGEEIYSFNQVSLGNQKISSIASMWLDSSNLNVYIGGPPAINRVLVNVGSKNPGVRPAANLFAYQNIVIRQDGIIDLTGYPQGMLPAYKRTQRYYLLPTQHPFQMEVSMDGSGMATPQPPPGNYVTIVLFNYNVFETAFGVHPPQGNLNTGKGGKNAVSEEK